MKAYLRSGGIVILCMVFGKILSLFWKALLARLGIEMLGTVEVALSTFTVLSSVTLLGFQTSLVRFSSIAKIDDKHTVSVSLLVLTLLVSLVLSGILIICFFFIPNIIGLVTGTVLSASDELNHVILFLPVFAYIELFLGYLNANRYIVAYGIGSYILLPLTRLVLLLGILSFGLVSPDSLVFHIVLAAVIVAFILAVRIAGNIRKVKISLPARLIGDYFRYSLPMSGSFVLYVFYASLDVLLLNRFANNHSVGMLAGITTIIDSLDILFLPFLNLFHSFIAEHNNDLRKGLQFTKRIMVIMLVVGAMAGYTLYSLRHILVTAFLGKGFGVIEPLIGIFLLLKLFQSVFIFPLRHFLDFYGYVSLTFLLMLLTLVAKLILGFQLIPGNGLEGVVGMMTGSYLIHFLACLFAVIWVLNSHRKKPDTLS